MKERLLAKLQELIQKFRIADENFWKTDSLEQFEYGVEKDAINDTIKKLQLNFAMAFPEEEKEKIRNSKWKQVMTGSTVLKWVSLRQVKGIGLSCCT